MMANKFGTIARSEIFDVANPVIKLETVSSDIRVFESADGKTHIEIHAESEEARNSLDFIEIEAHGNRITLKADKRVRGAGFFSQFRSSSFAIVVRLPITSALEVITVSADVEVQASVASAKVKSVSGTIIFLENPKTKCSIRTVSGDITAHTFSECDYSLRSVSGDILVHIIPGLEIDVDGKSVSGALESEIALDSDQPASASSGRTVKISASTVSGDLKIARS